MLLDHGVYRSLDDDTRRTWCKLWRGLIAGDEREMRAAVNDLGVDPDLTDFFRIVLALVPARVVEDVHGTRTSAVISSTRDLGDDEDDLGARANGSSNNLAGFSTGVDKLSSFGKREVMRDVLGVKVERQTELFETLPRDLLMILKANNLLRYVNEQLDSPVNRFRSIVASAEEGLAVTHAAGAEGILERRARERNGGRWGESSSAARWSYGAQVGAALLPLRLAMMKGKIGFGMWRKAKEEAAAAAQAMKGAAVGAGAAKATGAPGGGPALA